MITSLIKRLIKIALKYSFRVQVLGLENYTQEHEPTLIISNHLSLLDGVFLFFFLPQDSLFLVNRLTADIWYFKPFLFFIKMLKIDSENPIALKKAVAQIKNGSKIIVFPEGRISTLGIQMKIYPGAALIAEKSNATILPVAIEGLQYSFLSYQRDRLKQRFFPKVTISILPARKLKTSLQPTSKLRREQATALLDKTMKEANFESIYSKKEKLFEAVIQASVRHGRLRRVLSDASGINLTYQALLARSFILGQYILNKTEGDEDTIGVLLPNTTATAITFFGIQYAGKRTALLNFTSGLEGLNRACTLAKISTVITSKKFIEVAKLSTTIKTLRSRINFLFLEEIKDDISPIEKLAGYWKSLFPLISYRMVNSDKASSSCAVILFTSGSEGLAKGVALSHQNILSNYAQVQSLVDLNHTDKILNALPLFHAFGLLGGFLLPLLKGTESLQYPSPLHYRKIPEICYTQDITCLLGTNTFLNNYAKYAKFLDFHKLRYVLAGAEKLTESTRSKWVEQFGISIFEGYGVTEASPALAINYPGGHLSGTVGMLLAKIESRITAIDGLVEGGLLSVRGPNVMMGYLEDNGEIEPTSGIIGPGWYDTGDIVDINSEGYITILGRGKRFAKIGGEMVSLASVEQTVAARWPEGEHVAENALDQEKGEQIILVTTNPNISRSELNEALKHAGKTNLLMPKKIIFIAKIPYLGSGKIDHESIKKSIFDG
jgi:acyl-[acyl-carrier-protein]-phospholipid O-acyltransferase / long-chain-fatty-acid--[acyl-carrier-protein] ligase